MRCRSRSTACGKGVGSRPKVAALSKALMGLLRSLCEICHGNGWAFTRATHPCRASRCRGQAARGAPPRRTPTLRGVSDVANRHCPAPEALPKPVAVHRTREAQAFAPWAPSLDRGDAVGSRTQVGAPPRFPEPTPGWSCARVPAASEACANFPQALDAARSSVPGNFCTGSVPAQRHGVWVEHDSHVVRDAELL